MVLRKTFLIACLWFLGGLIIPLFPQQSKYEIGRTWYDYTDNVGRNMSLALNSQDGQDGIHFTFMKILPQNTERKVVYDYFDLNLGYFWGNYPLIANERSGFGRIATGKNDEALIVLHTSSETKLYADNAEAGYAFSEKLSIPTQLFPSLTVWGDTVVVTTRDLQGGIDSMLYSFDYMQTWQGAAIHPFAGQDGSGIKSEPHINPANPSEISLLAYNDSDTTMPNGLYIATTNDWGTTWTTDLISDSAFLGMFARDQINSLQTADSTFHIVFNDFHFDSSGVPVFPVIYWNNRERQFIELTGNSWSHPQNPNVQNSLILNRPGNGIGNAYPQISAALDGGLFVVWQQWEKDSTGGVYKVLPAGGLDSIYVTDIWGAYSFDDGRHWQPSFWLSGSPGISEVYPNLPLQGIRDDNGDYVMDFMYFEDTNPGLSIIYPGQSYPSECIWYFEEKILVIPRTGEPVRNTSQSFALMQNYPNPFNPLTTIQYQLPKAANVKLAIFNNTGQKVKTLVNDYQSAGSYIAHWNGTNDNCSPVASGIYLYRLSGITGSDGKRFEKVKKMLIIR